MFSIIVQVIGWVLLAIMIVGIGALCIMLITHPIKISHGFYVIQEEVKECKAGKLYTSGNFKYNSSSVLKGRYYINSSAVGIFECAGFEEVKASDIVVYDFKKIDALGKAEAEIGWSWCDNDVDTIFEVKRNRCIGRLFAEFTFR